MKTGIGWVKLRSYFRVKQYQEIDFMVTPESMREKAMALFANELY